MRNLVTTVATAALLVPFFAPPVFGGGKPPPSAFGKELVPDEQTQERNEPKNAELEELQDKEEDAKGSRRVRPVRRGKKVRIQLDGDEDGGDDGSDDSGGF